MSRYLAAYDVSRDSARAEIAAILQEFGVRRQRSVFEIDVESGELPELRRRVGARLSPQDRFDLVPVDSRPDRQRLAWGDPAETGEAVTFL